MVKIHFITNTAPLYRKNLWATLLKEKSFSIDFFFGSNKINVESINFHSSEFSSFQNQLHNLRNIWFKKKHLIWQTKVVRNSLMKNPDLVVLLGEFNVLSNWVISIIYRLRNIKVVMYGHGMYGNEKGLKLFLRKAYYKLANAHMVYEKRAKNIMVQSGFIANDIHVFYNSLDYEKQFDLRHKVVHFEKNKIFPFFENPTLPTLLFIGRLTPEKKLTYLLEVANLLNENGIEVNLLIIGTGTEEKELKSKATRLVKKNFHFYGSCYDENILGQLIANADLCISPGNVGLTAIHCFSYGTPVATHSNFFKQNPEVESITDGTTGFLFKEDDVDDLFKKTKDWLIQNKMQRDRIRLDCYNIVDTYYNPNYQTSVLKKMISEQLVR